MVAIKIIDCSNISYWYSNLVGCYVPYISQDNIEFLTRQPDGYLNIVKRMDGELVELTDDSQSMYYIHNMEV